VSDGAAEGGSIGAAGGVGGRGFAPPPLVWETLGDIRAAAERFPGGAIDLTIGTPTDPPAPAVVAALGSSDQERGYPPSIGTPELRQAASDWMARRLGATVPADQVAVTIGSKELVAGVPQWLHLRRPDRDTVLYPSISYPTYAMGATLASLRSVPVAPTASGALDLASIDPGDAARALCLWSNSPANPTGALDDLGAAARWGREHDVPVLSDECYAELTWSGPARTILEHGDEGVLAVHSLSKRSNLAGVRCGFYAGDAELVGFLSQIRKHAGFMVPGPVQAAAVVALRDDAHVDEQRARYRRRLDVMIDALRACGFDIDGPGGAFYLWVPAADGDGAALTRWFATETGLLVTPGETYGPDGVGHVRLALVQPDGDIDEAARRLRSVRAG
jgi:succinyldiaminopimelate transaminase